MAAVRRELEEADALATVPGQLALLLASQVAAEPDSGLPPLIRELRTQLDQAKRDAPALPDEVMRARAKRDEVRRAAGYGPEGGSL